MFPQLGQISFFPYHFAPSGWLYCHGQLLSIAENDALYFLLRNKFGGDGQTTFALPDLRNAAPPEYHYCIATKGYFKPNNYEGLLGETFLSFDASSAQNLLECTGQSLTKNQYPLLEVFMGTRFGGSGGNFNLPDLRGKAPDGFRYVMSVTGDDPNFRNHRDPLVGELFLLPYEVNADTFLPCDGRNLPVNKNQALYSLIGNTFGGDSNMTNFNLPDMRSMAPAKFSYYICSAGVYPNRP